MFDESLHTLKFASRVKKIKSKPVSVTHMDEKALLQRYKHEVESLRQKLQESNNLRSTDRDPGTIDTNEKLHFERKLEESRQVMIKAVF